MKEAERPVQALVMAIADEMRVARALLEELAVVFISDERFVQDYMHQLQAFDLIVQHIEESASLLKRVAGGGDIAQAVDAVGLAVMQQRLRDALD